MKSSGILHGSVLLLPAISICDRCVIVLVMAMIPTQYWWHYCGGKAILQVQTVHTMNVKNQVAADLQTKSKIEAANTQLLLTAI